jgi:hypothetical protein
MDKYFTSVTANKYRSQQDCDKDLGRIVRQIERSGGREVSVIPTACASTEHLIDDGEYGNKGGSLGTKTDIFMSYSVAYQSDREIEVTRTEKY